MMFFILETPIFLTKHTSQKVKQGETAVFQVNVDGYPLPNITWLFNDGELTVGNNIRVEIDRTTGDSKLWIDKVDLEQHIGTVTCRIGNIHGRTEEIVRLDIGAAPIFKTQLNTKEKVASGADIILKVVAVGSPRPLAQWYYNDKALETSNVAYDELKNEYRLTIEKASFANNDGRYRVVLQNELGESESTTCVLRVLDPVKLLKIVPISGTVNLQVDEPLELSFDIDANEESTVQLYRNQKKLKFTCIEEGRHVYKVDKVRLEDQGVYKVIVEDGVSMKTGKVNINVNSKLYSFEFALIACIKRDLEQNKVKRQVHFKSDADQNQLSTIASVGFDY